MGFKDEMKREIRKVLKDAEKELGKSWSVDYQGHHIEVLNEIMEEHLKIDGVIVASNKRKHWLSHLIPFSKLQATLVLEDGTKHTVRVKLGGYIQFQCKIKIDQQVIFEMAKKLDFIPWEHKEKIVPYIKKQLELNPQALGALPDDEYIYEENQLKMAPGLADQLVRDTTTPFYTKKLVALFEEQAKNPTTKTRKKTYEKILEERFVSYGQELIDKLQETKIAAELLEREALWLIDNAAHRDVVKFAVVVLALTNAEAHKDLLMTIAQHEEFTTYVIFTLNNGTKNANEHIWTLAKSLKGWGKIEAVTSLQANSPEVKHWLLTEGCKNDVMNDYLALTCAVNGELDVALHEENISKQLYDGAAVIISGLLGEAGNRKMDDYAYAGAVLSRFVIHAQTHCQTLADLHVLIEINDYMEVDEAVWEERYAEQWRPYERVTIQEHLQDILNNPEWQEFA